MTPPEILSAHSTSGREYITENTENNRLLIFVRSSSNFPLFGGPYLQIGVDIRTLTPPSASGRHMLKSRQEGKFSYGYSKGVSGNAEKFVNLS